VTHSVLWRYWLGGRKGIRSAKNEWLGGRKGIRSAKNEWLGAGMVICMEWGADLHMAQLMPLPLTVSCFCKIQIGFTFLVLAHPGSPRKRAIKRVCVCALVTWPINIVWVPFICLEWLKLDTSNLVCWLIVMNTCASITMIELCSMRCVQGHVTF